MGRDLAKQFPTAAELFQKADEILERSLTGVMWNGPIEELTKTSNCQPALFLHALAALAVLREIAGEFPTEGDGWSFVRRNDGARRGRNF